MKLHTTVQNEAVLSNVGEIGEFRIRNSAKAFNILSSGLYANKIRAIIRELSCNAVDSHVAASKADTPFEVHLPNQLEPWFSVRDYGTGLTHDQVTNIYTTYFESTKTDSNSFIGALGLGSKSPFSYTDNFTVTAIRDNRKGIYTAFINDQGVPSIALMHESESTEPNGVEVKFAVTNQYDFNKFRDEAVVVYKYFKLRPKVIGNKSFNFVDPIYRDKDIIPGVHTIKEAYYSPSIAVMGNIAYPIEIPKAESLGPIGSMLGCNLVIEFDIGELDFQASREGLSYIPSTIESIKKKLVALNERLYVQLESDANNIENYWERGEYLVKRFNDLLWRQAAIDYTIKTNFPLAHGKGTQYNLLKPFVIEEDCLNKKFNIRIKGFNKMPSSNKCSNLRVSPHYDKGTSNYKNAWHITPDKTTCFVVTDTKRGAFERAKYHWKSNKHPSINNVYLIEPFDKNKAMNTKSFFKEIYNPPKQNIMMASSLDEKERSVIGSLAKTNILRLEEHRKNWRSLKIVWANAGTLQDFDKNKTYYYVEMNNWAPIGIPNDDIKFIRSELIESKIFTNDIYGVRKAEIESIKQQKNWVNLSEFLPKKLKEVAKTSVMNMVKSSIDLSKIFSHNQHVNGIDKDSPYSKLFLELKDIQPMDMRMKQSMERLFKLYNISTNVTEYENLVTLYKKKLEEVIHRYPLLCHLQYGCKEKDVIDYINMVDKLKGF